MFREPSPCCAPQRSGSVAAAADESATGGVPLDVVRVEAGEFVMGDDSHWIHHGDGEDPTRTVATRAYGIERAPVTNARFAEFVRATGWTTTAEHHGWSFVFAARLPADFPPTRGVAHTPWWREVAGASWRTPFGPGSSLDALADHPVVHVSWIDASAFARWIGGRLPSEAEWERAARGGTTTIFPWGDELEPAGTHAANVFQGDFPGGDTGADGWVGTSPVGTYPPNGFGLVDVIGNAWEWTAEPWAEESKIAQRVLKGGSHLCHESYCRRYRPAARIAAGPETTTGHIGFRCALD